MDKKAKFTAALNAIKTNRFKSIYKFSIFIALFIVMHDVLSTGQDVDLEENKKLLQIVLDLYQLMSDKALLALAYIVVGFIASLFHMVSLFGINDPVVAISLILVCFAFVADLISNAPSQQNDLPAQCGTLAYRFYFTKIASAMLLGEVVMKIKSNLISGNTNSDSDQQP